ncbi:MAG: enoyl-CoA hydratase/isomerase family protein [Bdellovibrionales bacterium]|nr:enoyl-CoA hydratase/isomerase family protein [Bdellovibrionales bacterium]
MAISVKFQSGIIEVTHSNENSRNAFHLEDANTLAKALKAKKEIKGLVWRSSGGRVFCSGGDLSFYAKLKTRMAGIEANRKIRAALEQLNRLNCPTAVAVSGDVLGGGVELLSAFDYVVAEKQVIFSLWQRRIGLSFGWGGGARLMMRIPLRRLRRMAIEARVISAFRAFEEGIVDQIANPGCSLEAAKKWVVSQTNLPIEPVRVLKTLDSKNEAKSFEQIWQNPSHKKILKDFLSRKK